MGPRMHADGRGFEDPVTEVVLGAAFEVASVLGPGFLEKVYERAMLRELHLRGSVVRPQASIPVRYKGEPIGEYFADLLIEEQVIVELKCVEAFSPEHAAQCLNYLKASGLTTCLLINFQRPRVEWRRIVLGL